MSNKDQPCPITGRPYFMHIEHPDLGNVPTYGGPFDSYTVPALDDEGEIRCERYDHDRGEWIEGGEDSGLIAVREDEFNDMHSLLSVAVTAEKTDFDLPADWIHRASAATGAAVGSEFVPKRATSSEVHRMRAALTAVHDEFVRWDILPADKCREMRKALRQLLAEVRR